MTFEQIIIQCSAPSICGIKPGNMFTTSSERYSEEIVSFYKNQFLKYGIFLKTFKTSKNLVMFFTYDFVWIRKILGDSFVKAYLAGKNYPVEEGIFSVMEELFKRLQKQENFPHEVGIFLGYPLEDVISFEQMEGKNCKYCGYWKSYQNPEEAKLCRCKYNNCSQMCKKWFDEGLSVSQIIKKYKKVTEQVA